MNTEDMNDVSHDHPPDVGWGTPSPRPARSDRPTEHGAPSAPIAWAALRRALLWLVLVLGVAGIGLGLYVVAEDMAETTDMFHGLGVALGLALAVPCLVISVVAGFGLRSMQLRGPEGGRAQTVAVGMLLVLLILFVGLSPFMLLPVALGIVLILSVVAERSGRP